MLEFLTLNVVSVDIRQTSERTKVKYWFLRLITEDSETEEIPCIFKMTNRKVVLKKV